MPDIYEIQGPDGRIIEIESSRPPTAAEAARAISALGLRPVADTRGPVERFASNLYHRSPLPLVPATAAGAANVVANPIETWGGVKPLGQTVGQMLTGTVQAHIGQGRQAWEAAKEAVSAPTWRQAAMAGSEAIGHGAAALLPVVGPMAAEIGEQLGSGDVAGAAGGTVGLLSPLGVRAAREMARGRTLAPTPTRMAASRTTKAAALERAAERQVTERVLAPGNRAYIHTAERIAPDVLKKRLPGNRDLLRDWADTAKGDAWSQIEAVVAKQPNARINIRPAVDRLSTEIDDLMRPVTTRGPSGRMVRVNQVIPGKESYVNELTRQRDFLGGQGMDLPFSELRRLRVTLDQIADEAKVYARAGNQVVSDQGAAAAKAAAALREQLAHDIPDLALPNADFSFAAAVADVLDPAIGRPKATAYVPTGITGGLATTGAIIGAVSKTPVIGSLIGSQLLPRLKAWMASPSTQMAHAQAKMRAAEALRRGDVGRAKSLILQFAPRPESNTE